MSIKTQANRWVDGENCYDCLGDEYTMINENSIKLTWVYPDAGSKQGDSDDISYFFLFVKENVRQITVPASLQLNLWGACITVFHFSQHRNNNQTRIN